MCGIAGYIGNKSVSDELIDSLKKLEYRGYDSAGIAEICGGEIIITKAEGKIVNLENVIKQVKSSCGIAHTRWATHGVPSVANAHPHKSKNGEWAVVHNGIIENYSALKSELCKGVEFASQTDTEVIPQLLSLVCCEDKMKALIDVCAKLQGSYALACVNKSEDNTLYLARSKSPLYVAQGNDEVFVASDPICFAGKAHKYYALEDGEFCKATQKELEFYDCNYKVIKKITLKLSDMQENSGKQNYPHYMLKEINQVPLVLARIVNTYSDNNVLESFTLQYLNNYNKIVIVGCGTAYHAGLMGARFIEKFARVECKACVASEFRYSNPIIDGKTLCIFVSQSGETADTLACCDLAKQMGAQTIALTNVLYSTLAKKVDKVLPVCAGPEIAVASTKAYTAQISILYMLAKRMQNVIFNKDVDFLDEIKELSQKIIMPSAEEIRSFSDLLEGQNKAFFLGRDVDYYTCEEASLKLKEISYINCSAHPAGELKHGFLALIEEDTVVFVVATQKDLLEKTLNGCHEASARGGKIVFVSPFNLSQDQKKHFFKEFKLPEFSEDLQPIVSIGFFQMLAYLTSVARGVNPDQPRNLAKSVTVE